VFWGAGTPHLFPSSAVNLQFLTPCRTDVPLRAHEKPGIMIGQGKRNLKQEKLEKPPNIEEVFVLMLPGA
jgi:hypothetical protein